ncbi:MAG: 50S ribosomal protein L32 [Phycisphaerae bacterium]|nr:50S ribosomal protein L32 [Phycisphaerae bacterium]
MLPARRTSRSRSRTRRSHEAIKPVHYVLCPKCSQAKLPHAACSNCGYVNPSLTLKLGKEETA